MSLDLQRDQLLWEALLPERAIVSWVKIPGAEVQQVMQDLMGVDAEVVYEDEWRAAQVTPVLAAEAVCLHHDNERWRGRSDTGTGFYTFRDRLEEVGIALGGSVLPQVQPAVASGVELPAVPVVVGGIISAASGQNDKNKSGFSHRAQGTRK